MIDDHFPNGLEGKWIELSAIQRIFDWSRKGGVRRQFLTDTKFLRIAQAFSLGL